ncbi:unnamed protein product [Orchesella dallaii]|uniref:C-type lectin domain-containing protein n=1 Tax=Orchesella dallaii TaxID=48710 RepID=A0ABP1PIP3_9HEXA
MKTFLVALILGSSMMIASPRTLRLDISTKPELNTNTTATSSIRNTTLVTIGTFGGISYFVDGIPRNWNDSKSFCESHEAHLAKIDNKNQLQFLRKAVLNLGSQQWLWVSSTGDYEEPGFVNLDGHCPALPPNFIDLLIRRRCTYKFFSLCQTVDSGEFLVTPDSISKAISGKDENIGIKSDENIRSTTESTSVNTTSLNQLWEINVNNTNATEPTAFPTPKQTLIRIGTFRGKSYFGDRVFRNWSESKSFCEEHGLELAEIDNDYELQFLRNTVRAVVYQEWSWVSNMGGYEVNKNCRKPSGYCPVLGPYGQGYIRRRCSDRRFGLCQTVRSSEEYFTPGSSSEEESSEETQTTTESTKNIGKAVNQEKSRTEVFFQLLRDSFPWSSLQAITKGIPVVMGDYSALKVIQESES